MSSSNWQNFREESPAENDFSNRYRIDNVGLQVGLGLPGFLLIDPPLAGDNDSDNDSWKLPIVKPKPKETELEKTVDGIPIRTVYVTNIHPEVQLHEVMRIFSPHGYIVNIYLSLNKHNNKKQHAFVTFMNPLDASRVIKQIKFRDWVGRTMFAMAADSWHQPKETPDGGVIWRSGQRAPINNKKENEEDSELARSPIKKIQIEQEDGLNSLNDDCLMHIFSFLTWKEIAGIERVCKRWQGLSYRMWRCIRELNVKNHPFDKLLHSTPVLEQCLKRCGESLTSLELSKPSNCYNQATLAIIAKYCTNLEKLYLAGMNIGNRTLAHLGRQCPHIKTLILEKCTKYSDQEMMSLLPKCSDLTYLELKHCAFVTGLCLAKVTGPISSLVLSNCPKVDPTHLITGLQRISESLQELSLNACGMQIGSNANALSTIILTVPNVTSLSLCNLGCFVSSDFKCLAAIGTLSQLTRLNLTLNPAVNDAIIAPIVEGCQELYSLNLSSSGNEIKNLTDEGLSLLGRLPKLTNLDISYLEATTNKALKNITTRNNKLKILVCRGCPKITDGGSSQVITVSNDLEVFDLSGCDVGNETVDAAQTSVKMRTNNVPLRLIVGGTRVLWPNNEEEEPVPQLTVDLSDLCDDSLRPDFMDDLYFPYSDDEDDDDELLDHLCDRIAFLFGIDLADYLNASNEDGLSVSMDESDDSWSTFDDDLFP